MDMSKYIRNWIWTPDWSAEDDKDVRIVYFRKEFEVTKLPENCLVKISADSGYKLYINGKFVQKGPQKAMDRKEWFVDCIDIAPYLTEGKNVAAVEVIRFPECNYTSTASNNNDSLLRTPIANLFVQSLNSEETGIVLNASIGWKCSVNREIKVVREVSIPSPIHVQEVVSATDFYRGWKETGYDDSAWDDSVAKLLFDVPMADAPANQVDRTIPFMRHEEKRFDNTVCIRIPKEPDSQILQELEEKASNGGVLEAFPLQGYLQDLKIEEKVDESEAAQEALCSWNMMLNGNGTVTIPANSSVVVEISAGVEECGFLEYAFAGGKGAKVETTCAECYVYKNESPSPVSFLPNSPLKGDRTDFRNGSLFGYTSSYTLAGFGTAKVPETYEPYWFRTFRYIQLRITTREEPVTVTNFSYRETGYPLEVKTTFETSDQSLKDIWDISVRTLKRCMHETYIDCPFYEQLQYAMDSRSEILYTYNLSGDDRLARQAMEAFRRSQRPDGMINSCAPTEKSNVIPGFSIYYLMMVYDHMMYFGDKTLVKTHFPAIDNILNFFDNHLAENGLVEKIGGPLMAAKYWSFIDWSKKWGDNGGVPNAANVGTGAITMESLLYVYGLIHAAKLAEFIGRKGVGQEYMDRADAVKAAIRKQCMGTYTDPQGRTHDMIQDGPGVEEYSAHCQIFAILTDTVSVVEGRKMLLAAINDPDLAQASVSFMFYLFRALEKTDLYEMTDRYWNLWRQMLKDNMTTCVENDTDARSDCHAWASLICYEIPAVYMGVRPTAPGFSQMGIKPLNCNLPKVTGNVITPHGFVHVE